MYVTIRGRKVKLSLAWLKPPPMPPDGNMTLFEHLRELRYRLVISALAVIVGVGICAVFYSWPHGGLLAVMLYPFDKAHAMLGQRVDTHLVLNDVGGPFSLAIKVVGIAGLVVAAPVVLYQLWSFIVPGLLAREKKWALIFVGAATPLFLAGVAIGYMIMPKAITVLIGFTPAHFDVQNLLDIGKFLGFLIKMMLVFGLAFLVPLVILMLNFLGVVKAKWLAKFRVYIIFGCFVFGAVATPSTDPFSMCALAVPMCALFIASEVIARIHDRRLARRGGLDDPTQRDSVLARLQAEDRARRGVAEPAMAEQRRGIATAILNAMPERRGVDAKDLKSQILALGSGDEPSAR